MDQPIDNIFTILTLLTNPLKLGILYLVGLVGYDFLYESYGFLLALRCPLLYWGSLKTGDS